MGRLIDGHAVHVGLEIRAVVQVIAAQQILIRLPLSAVQGHDEAGDGLQQLAGAVLGRQLKLLVIDHAFARGIRGSEQLQPLGGDRDFPQ